MYAMSLNGASATGGIFDHAGLNLHQHITLRCHTFIELTLHVPNATGEHDTRRREVG